MQFRESQEFSPTWLFQCVLIDKNELHHLRSSQSLSLSQSQSQFNYYLYESKRYVESALIEGSVLDAVYSTQKKEKVDFCVKMFSHFNYDGEINEIRSPLDFPIFLNWLILIYSLHLYVIRFLWNNLMMSSFLFKLLSCLLFSEKAWCFSFLWNTYIITFDNTHVCSAYSLQ